MSMSWVCVCQLVYAFPSSSTFIYNYHHIHIYICDDYCAMTTYKLNIPIMMRLCVPASRGVARCLHTCDPMFKGLYFGIHTCLYCFLWIHTHHVHIKTCLIVYAPPLSICALFNYVFIRVYYIHLNTCSCMNVYTKTVQNK